MDYLAGNVQLVIAIFVLYKYATSHTNSNHLKINFIKLILMNLL